MTLSPLTQQLEQNQTTLTKIRETRLEAIVPGVRTFFLKKHVEKDRKEAVSSVTFALNPISVESDDSHVGEKEGVNSAC